MTQRYVNNYQDFLDSLDLDYAHQLQQHLGYVGPSAADIDVEEGTVEDAENLEVIINGSNLILKNKDPPMQVVLTPKGKPVFADMLYMRIIYETDGMDYEDYVRFIERCDDPKA